MARLDTKLESEGAEFLVLGNLLIEGVATYKTYHNFAGYDLIATNSSNGKSIRIQVKSRFKTAWDGFIINNFNCDFVVFVALNRGFKKIKKNGDNGIKQPDYYVFPISYVLEIKDNENTWGKIRKGNMKDYESFLNRWDLIKNKLDF
jgi:hypothetical protein